MIDYALSTQQLAVISALSSGATTTVAAEEAGVHRNTVANWRRNQLPFQYALAHAQYDRALLFREKAEALVDLAIQTLHDLLVDPETPAGVRLKAALAILQTAATPPAPKQQVELDIEKIKFAHNAAQSAPAPPPEAVAQSAAVASTPQPVHNSAQPKLQSHPLTPAVPSPKPQPVLHNHAQVPYRREQPKIGRNDVCPCGSGLKYKRCCIGKAA